MGKPLKYQIKFSITMIKGLFLHLQWLDRQKDPQLVLLKLQKTKQSRREQRLKEVQVEKLKPKPKIQKVQPILRKVVSL